MKRQSSFSSMSQCRYSSRQRPVIIPHVNKTSPQGLRGFSLVEVMIAVFLIAITLVPAIDSLSTAMLGSSIHTNLATNRFRLMSKMEEVLTKPLTELVQLSETAGSASVIIDAYSDSAATPQRRVVFLSPFDGDNADADNNGFTGTDDDLLWVQVKIVGSTLHLETLTGVSP